MVAAVAVTTAAASNVSAEKYEPTWKSLDRRPVPAWHADAKFGIFIHWGPYSVPAWAPVGTYSEWYQYWLQNKTCSGNSHPKPTAVYDYHVKTYGKDFSYYQFGELFKAQDFDPAAWAKLFERAGAKYIVLTSKHHDGFCLWPNQHANKAYGRPWNSMDAGPHRDLVGELKQAVEKTPVKFALYYSLYEWYNPLWKDPAKRGQFVEEHFLPQVKELVTRYRPAILWTDGDWEASSSFWKSCEFLAWLYNESPVRDTVLVNDRWGKECRLKHGGVPTTEYDSGTTFDKPWEECRGIGFSFGYNRNEDVQDYNSAQVLVLTLVDTVSHGGNLLLDIGPDGSGKIPPIMQERLLEIGQWLRVNGEAIYGTRKWKTMVQWSTGEQLDGKQYRRRKNLSYVGGDFILKQTLHPDPGMAVKEVFFTAKGHDVYAILPKLPEGKLLLKTVDAQPSTRVSLLGTGKTFAWQKVDGGVEVSVPPLLAKEVPCQYAWVLKLTNVR
jgi:alpha-L-fucosidase